MKKLKMITGILIITLLLFSCANNAENNNGAVNLNDRLNNEIQIQGNETDIEIDNPDGFKGYLWSVEHEDSTVYLFGSIHMAKEDLYPFHESVENAFNSSDYLAVEADVTDMSQMQAMALSMMYQGEETIYDHLSQEGREKFELVSEDLGINPKLFEKIKIWATGSNLMSLQLMQGGYSADSGVDMYFINEAKKREIALIELEGAMFQLDMMNGFPVEAQEEMFLMDLGTTEETVESFEELYSHYMTRDLNDITEYLMENEISSYPEIEDAMLLDRNIGMTEKIEGYLQTDDTYFVVVGLAHLLGDESVVKLLGDQGYLVKYHE
jgi:hypothetical protein